MRKFVSAIIVVVLLVGIIEATLLCFTLYIENSVSFKLTSEKKVLVIGDSTMEKAVDPSFFSEAENVGASGVANIFSYVKLKRFVEENPQLTTIVLSCFHKSMVDVSWVNTALTQMTSRHLFLMDREEVVDLMHNKYFYIGLLKTPYRELLPCLRVLRKGKTVDYSSLSLGGYVASNHVMGEFESETVTTVPLLNELHVHYLDKIVSFCQSHNLRLVLVDVPKFLVSEDLSGYLIDRYPNVEYIHYESDIIPLEGYSDYTHLNSTGARIFTSILRNDLGFE